jgi:RNA polymerase sigma-70 factor (ECF subfamily)
LPEADPAVSDLIDGRAIAGTTTDNRALAGRLFRQEWSGLVAYLRRRLGGDGQAAQDMAQEALSRILEARRRYSTDHARGLLYGVARNLLVDHFRAERTRTATTAAVGQAQQAVEPIDALRDLVAREDLDRVHREIHALPPRCRQIFVLNRFEQMSFSAIARHCGISQSMVEKHMMRALCQLAAALNNDGDDHVDPDEDE